MKDTAQIYSKLSDVFCSVFDDDIVLSPELTAHDIEGWDSLTHMRLIITVQQAFDIKFSAAEVGGLENVGDMVKLIQSKS
jgi:acyl carrier protein